MTRGRGQADVDRRWRPPLYLLALPATFVLRGLMEWPLSPYAFVRSLAFALAIGLVCALIGRALAGDRDRGGLAGLALIVALVGGAQPLVLLAAGMLLAVAVLVGRRSAAGEGRIRWSLVTRALNMAAVVALLAISLKGVQDGRWPQIGEGVLADAPVHIGGPAAKASSRDLPDIYLILLDGYLRPDRQLELMGVDQSAFVGGLQDDGFDIVQDSRSNYLLTKLSLTSMLNMRPVDALPDDPTHEAVTSEIGAQSPYLNHAASLEAARDAGYEIVGVSSGFEEVTLREATRFIDTGQPSDVELMLLGSTAFLPALEAIDPGWAGDQHRARVEGIFDTLANLAAERHASPRFVLAHVPSPHSPIVFGAAGERLAPIDPYSIYQDPSSDEVGMQAYISGYGAQATYIGERTLDTINRILSTAGRPPVIIIFSDHGSALNWSSNDMAGSDLDQRTANFIATLTPGHPRLLPDDATLVNVLGPILNTYLGTAFPKQDDTSYLWLPGPPSTIETIDLPRP